MDKKVIIIGTGKVGFALGYALYQKNYDVYCYDRNLNKLKQFYRLIKKPLPQQLPFKDSKIVFITTQDSEIKKTYEEILPHLAPGCIVVHCSGALSRKVFKTTDRKKIIRASIHPIQTFVKFNIRSNPFLNIYFGVETDRKARPYVLKIIKDLGAQPVFISPKDKPLYHLVMVLASNYFVTLMNAVQILGAKIRLSQKKLFKIIEPLIMNTFYNIKNYGAQNALSGPIKRGDVLTIKTHIKILKKKAPKLLKLYSVLGKETVNLSALPSPKKKILKRLFKT
ncbi:MAG: DUF2520 domain-containing protein [candidate division WOR-3 bacterium]|nr:DUF2520 domain-containing protein [candidate division WOR-3 bacterium]